MKLHRIVLALAVLLAACGGSSQPATTAPTTSGTAPADDPSCPVVVPGTSVTVEDTATGAGLVFVTTGDAAEVRKRVAAMAKMHNDHHGAMGPLPDGKDAGGGHAGHDMSGHAGHDMSGQGSAGSAAGGHAGHDMKGGPHAGHAGGMISVHSKATTEDVPNGAKIVFTVGGADVAKIQQELRMHAQHLSSGSCKMDHS